MSGMLKVLARLVPGDERRPWLREWHAELQHAGALRRAGSGPPAGRSRLRVLLAAAEDAVRLGARRLAPGPVGQDVRFAVRVLRKSPGFTLVAALTLALGIGANAAIFTVVNAVLLSSLDYPEVERLVQLVNVEEAEETATVSLPNLRDYAEGLDAVAEIGYSSWWSPVYEADEPRRLDGMAVDSGYFRLFGGEPALGRYLSPAEDDPGAAASVVLSHGFWTGELGADPGIVGEEILLDGVPHTVVGVARAGLRDPLTGARDLWRSPPGYLAQATRRQAWLIAYGRLAEGRTLAGAQAETEALSAALAQRYPEANAERSVRLVGLHERLVAELRPAVLMLSGSVLLVLLIACANVANLMLARGTARDREIAVRAALGAGTGRLVRQLLTESLVLAALGGAAGVWLGWLGVQGVVALGAPGIPEWADLRLDARVLAFTAGATLLTGLLFGLAPVRSLVAEDAGAVLRQSAAGATRGRPGRRLRAGLAVAELALATVLLVAAVLMARSFINLSRADLGVEPGGVLTVSVTPSRGTPSAAADRAAYFERLRDRLEALPGVESVGQSNLLPFTGATSLYPFTVDDRPTPDRGDEPLAIARLVSPGYFEAMGIEVLQGRGPSGADGWESPRVVIVSETLARRFFGGAGAAVGESLTVHGASHEIAGVVRDVRSDGPAREPRPTLYTLGEQPGGPTWMRMSGILVVRVAGDPMEASSSVRAALWSVDADAVLDDVAPLSRLLERYRAAPRFQAALLAGFAAVATLLAAIGVAGVLSYGVAARTREIGVRRALGAGDDDVVATVLGDVGRLAAVGLTLGVLGALAATRLISGLLYGVAPTDASSFVLVAVGLAVVALLSGFFPARRAGRIDPMVALRGE